MQYGGGRHEPAMGGLHKKMAWALLVVVVPLLATVIMVGIVLQLVFHVRVWQTTEQWLGITHQPPKPPVVSQTARELASVRRTNASLNSQVASLTTEVSADQVTQQQLKQEVSVLEQRLKVVQHGQQQYKTEASVLAAMDAAAAALVVAKLPQSEAAACLAQMAPADAAQILAALTPTQSSQILPLLAKAKVATGH